MYLKDVCNCAGIVEVDDLDQISFFIGIKITPDHFSEIKKQIITIDHRRCLIPDFIDFQYGTLHEKHKMRKKVFSELAKFDIKYPIDTVSEISDTVKDKDKDKADNILKAELYKQYIPNVDWETIENTINRVKTTLNKQFIQQQIDEKRKVKESQGAKDDIANLPPDEDATDTEASLS